MFYGAERSGDWISSNYAEYNEFLGIGKPEGFLGLKKFFNTKGYQDSMAQSTSNLQGMSSIMSGMNLPSSTAPVSTQNTAFTWNPLNPSAPVTAPLNTNAGNLQSGQPLVFSPSSFSTALNNALGIKQDTASTVLGGGSKSESATTPAAATAPANPIGSGITTPSVDPRGTNVPKDNTILYVGLAGAGVLLITGFVYMASKGK
jgi:hypothetical protein